MPLTRPLRNSPGTNGLQPLGRSEVGGEMAERALMEPGLVPGKSPTALGVGTGVKTWVGTGWT